MSSYTHVRRYPRFLAYLPVQCTTLNHGRLEAKVITGKTKSISPGGLGLLLPDTIPLKTSISVQVCQEEPLHGRVIWLDRPTSTDLGTSIPHGVAFDHPVDVDRIRRWVLNAKHQAHPRVPVQFDVEFTEAGKARHGTCLNLSRGGMFIGTKDPPRPESEILLRFKLLDSPHTLSIPAQVVWVEIWPGVITGMGVKFLALNPSEAALIDTVVDRPRAEASPSLDSS
ncbi:MAG: PilZ domain-containing protein [Candidatus Methylomirabilales bacterium]